MCCVFVLGEASTHLMVVNTPRKRKLQYISRIDSAKLSGRSDKLTLRIAVIGGSGGNFPARTGYSLLFAAANGHDPIAPR